MSAIPGDCSRSTHDGRRFRCPDQDLEPDLLECLAISRRALPVADQSQRRGRALARQAGRNLYVPLSSMSPFLRTDTPIKA